MKKYLIISLLIYLFSFQFTFAQKCGLGKVTTEEFYKLTKNETNKVDLYPEDSQTYTIPVVFHVIYKTKNQGADRLSDAIYKRQLELCNQHFGRYGAGSNTNPVGTDAKIRFCLATKNPDGEPTTGIIKIQSENYSLVNTDNEMVTKDLSRWDQKKYLNIWIVEGIDLPSNIAGYSYFPTQSISNKTDPKPFDGLVVDYRFVSDINPYSTIGNNKGTTTTHEIGHYLNLMHPWGGDDFNAGQGGCDDDDRVEDTPPCDKVYQSRFPQCSTPTQCNAIRQIENYMDYSDERCVNLFTNGQATRMRVALRKYRPQLISCENNSLTGCSTGCTRLKATTHPNTVEINPNPSDGNLIFFGLLDDRQYVTIRIYNSLGQLVKQFDKFLFTSGTLPLSATDLASGTYHAMIQINDREQYQKIVIIK